MGNGIRARIVAIAVRDRRCWVQVRRAVDVDAPASFAAHARVVTADSHRHRRLAKVAVGGHGSVESRRLDLRVRKGVRCVTAYSADAAGWPQH